MSTPALIRLIESVNNKFNYPMLTTGAFVTLPPLLIYASLGAFSPEPGYVLWTRPAEIMGFFVLAAVIPAYLLMCFAGWVRLSNDLFAGIESQIVNKKLISVARYQYAAYWPAAIIMGLVFGATVSINWSSLEFDSESAIFAVSIGLVLAHTLLWSTVSLVLFFILHEDYVLFQYGKIVQVNLYDLDRLNDFGRSALIGVLMTVGALALMILQSLDREFSWSNYSSGLYVGIPAAIAFVLMPTWTIRNNIRKEKAKELEVICAEIRASSTGLDDTSLTRMNGLISRREQIQHLRNWPMDTSIFSRFLFYVFIPPLAWLGAALMEVLLDSYLVG